MLKSLPLLVACTAGSDRNKTKEAEPDTSDSAAVDQCDDALDADGDLLNECQELELGTDPDLADSDGDGLSDGAEVDCVSDPLDAAEQCYACGWPHGDPGDLVHSGDSVGDTLANFDTIDQCGETVPTWDLGGSYHILFMTAVW